MMLKAVLLLQFFYLSLGTNYFNDNDWILFYNQAWPLNTCQFNGIEAAFELDGKYLEYICNDDGSVTKYTYTNITENGECIDLESTANFTSFDNPSDVGAFECDSTNEFAQIGFTGYFFAAPPANQCVANPGSPFQGRGTYKWAVNACSANGNNSVLFTCDNDPGVITVTSYNNSVCDASDVIDVITINEGECVQYVETQQTLPPTVEGFGGQTVAIFAYAQFEACTAPTSSPTMMTTAPSMSPTINTTSPTSVPTNQPSMPTLEPTIGVTLPAKANTNIIFISSIIVTILFTFIVL